MKTIRNRTLAPIKVALPGGKTLYIGPKKTGQVSDQATERPSFRRLVENEQIEIVGEERGSASETDGGGTGQTSTHGHPQTRVVMPKGNR
jgi:hypothetical protein